MKRVIIVLTAAASLFLAPSAGAEKVTKYERFRLWNKCQPISLYVRNLNKEASKIDLKKEAITIAVRSRLRAARLYDADASPHLDVNVNVTSAAFSIILALYKPMKDYTSGESFFTGGWNINGVGTHGLDSNYILSILSQYTDNFIDEYLRVNNDACKR